MHDNIDGLGPDYWADKLAQHGAPRLLRDPLSPPLALLYEFMGNAANHEDRAPRATLRIGTTSGRAHSFGVNHYVEGLMLDGAPTVHDDFVTFYATNKDHGAPTITAYRIRLDSIETVRVDLIRMGGAA